MYCRVLYVVAMMVVLLSSCAPVVLVVQCVLVHRVAGRVAVLCSVAVLYCYVAASAHVSTMWLAVILSSEHVMASSATVNSD